MQKLPSNSIYYCEHLYLTRKTNNDVNNFTIYAHPEGKGLMDYLQQEAFRDENDQAMRTYLVRDKESKELVGYFSLRACSIKLEVMHGKGKIGIYPCIELAYFAINDSYMEKHPYNKGTGLLIFNDLIIPIVKAAARNIGAKGIIGYAIGNEKLLKRYIDVYGFSRLSSENEEKLHQLYRPENDKDCIFIYMDL